MQKYEELAYRKAENLTVCYLQAFLLRARIKLQSKQTAWYSTL